MMKQTEIGQIPEDWEVKTIEEVANVFGGGTPSTRDSIYWNGDINWFTPTEVGKSKYLYNSVRKITEEGLNNCSARILPKNTILITTRAGIGDLGILKIPSATNQGFQSLVPKTNIDYEFLYYLTSTLKPLLLKNASGSTFLEISPSKIKSIQIPVPPLPEQQAIAEVLSDTDHWVENLEDLIEKKKLIKQATMQKLLTPKDDWEVKKLGEVVNLAKSGGTPLSSNKAFYDGNIPFLSISDMTEQGKYLNWTRNSISQLGLDNSASWIVPENSIIYSMYASVGIVSINKIKLATSQAVLNIILKEQYHLEFIYYLLVSMQPNISKFVGEGTQKNLTAQSVKNFDLFIPPIEEQTRIATILSDMDTEIETLEQKLTKAQQIKQGLMQELLTGRKRLSISHQIPDA